MSNHSKQEKARIIGQLAGIYKNADSLITPTINQIDFEKAVNEDKTSFFFDNIVKGFAEITLKEVEAEEDSVKKSEILAESKKDLACLELINVVFDNVTKGIYVDVIDAETNTYKDNAVNRKFNRVGEIARIEKGGIGSGHYVHNHGMNARLADEASNQKIDDLIESAKEMAKRMNMSVEEAIDKKVAVYVKYAKSGNEEAAWSIRGDKAKLKLKQSE